MLLLLYKKILAFGSVKKLKEIIKEANKEVHVSMNIKKPYYIEASYMTCGKGYLYDKDAKDDNLETGGVFDLSPTRTQYVHTQDKLFMMPIFEKSDF